MPGRNEDTRTVALGQREACSVLVGLVCEPGYAKRRAPGEVNAYSSGNRPIDWTVARDGDAAIRRLQEETASGGQRIDRLCAGQVWVGSVSRTIIFPDCGSRRLSPTTTLQTSPICALAQGT